MRSATVSLHEAVLFQSVFTERFFSVKETLSFFESLQLQWTLPFLSPWVPGGARGNKC